MKNRLVALGSHFAAGLLLAGVSFPAAAAEVFWTGAIDDDWAVVGNWNGGVLPTAADDAIVDISPGAMIDGVDVGQVNNLIVGRSTTGSLTIQDGGIITSGSLVSIGHTTSSNGEVTVTGEDSLLKANIILVANFGVGALTIEDGGVAESTGNTFISRNIDENSVGTATVTGANSFLDVGGELQIGYQGTGTLVVEDGATVESASYTALGWSANSSGEATISGSGSSLTSNGILYVGYNGTGVLSVEDGATVESATHMYVGNNTNGDGTVFVTGTGSFLDVTGDFRVGNNGLGSIAVEGGANMEVYGLSYIGANAGSTGTMRISGVGSSFDADRTLSVGSAGIGHLIVEDGAYAEALNLITASTEDGYGTVLISGEGSHFKAEVEIRIGSLGEGTARIEDGGVLEAGGALLHRRQRG